MIISNHSRSKSRFHGSQGARSSLFDESDGEGHVAHVYYTNRSCYLASNSFYELNWPDFCADKCGVQGDCEGSQWQLDPENDVKGHKIVRKRNNDMDETSSSEGDDSEDEYDKSREQDSQDMEGSEERHEEDAGMVVPEDEGSEEGESEEDSDESPISRPRLLRTPNKKRKRNEDDHDNPFKTPSKRRRGAGGVDPARSKATLRRRRTLKFKVKPPKATAQDNTALQSLPADPYLRAMHTLHVGERPDTLPCRDEEYVAILEAVLELLQETSGGCICEYSSWNTKQMLNFV